MADQLASPEDLASLLQTTPDAPLDASTANMLLELATAKVQRAAGGQRIVDATDTAVIDVEPWDCDQYLTLPQLPVRSVSAVLIDGVASTDWLLRNQKLWRACGWGLSCRPTQVTVTYAHGYLDGSQWLQLARDATLSLARLGYGNPSGTTSEAIDDYRVTYTEADARMQMTEHMRAAIADAYGTGTYVTSSR